jgi:hypothetical protein
MLAASFCRSSIRITFLSADFVNPPSECLFLTFFCYTSHRCTAIYSWPGASSESYGPNSCDRALDRFRYSRSFSFYSLLARASALARTRVRVYDLSIIYVLVILVSSLLFVLALGYASTVRAYYLKNERARVRGDNLQYGYPPSTILERVSLLRSSSLRLSCHVLRINFVSRFHSRSLYEARATAPLGSTNVPQRR